LTLQWNSNKSLAAWIMPRLDGIGSLLFTCALLTHCVIADEPTPPGLNIQDIVEANTVQAHAGRQTSAVDNSTANPQGNSTGLAPTARAAASSIAAAGNAVGGAMTSAYNVTAEFISNITASSPAPAQDTTKGAAKAPTSYWVDADGLFVTSDGSWSYSDSKYAAPVALILLLLLLAGAGAFFIVRRRRVAAARNYYGLKEAELGATHRTV